MENGILLFALPPLADGVYVVEGIFIGTPELAESRAQKTLLCGPDADGDGIFNEVDPQVGFSDLFTDGTTGGRIIDRADRDIIIRDSPDPAAGVVIFVSPGASTARVGLCQGSAILSIGGWDEDEVVVATCNPTTIRVIAGSVEVRFTNVNLGTFTTRLAAGQTVSFNPGTSTFRAPASGAGPIQLNACNGSAVLSIGGWDDDEVVVSCGSVTITVVLGTVEVQYLGLNGAVVGTSTLGVGSTVTYEPSTITYIVPLGSASVVVLVNGVEFPIGPGQTLVRPTPVAIDIKPGSYPNSINLGSSGSVPVAIFSTATFDATTVDPLSITLAGASVKFTGKGTPMTSATDVNGDGRADLVVHVSTEALALTEGDVSALLQGLTADGSTIRGSDSIRVVP